MGDYKVSPELKRPAQAKWLSDDYVKFIRMSEQLIETNGEGVLGFITNHSYLDNPTFLDMRSHLRDTFDRIFVLDLHGSAQRKEVSPDGSPDKNVFDIQQGVAIIVAVKRASGKSGKKPPASVHHADLWGTRSSKYESLWENSPHSLDPQDVSPTAAPWLFKPSDREVGAAYLTGFSVASLFSNNGSPAPGIVTTHDQFAISWNKDDLRRKIALFLSTSSEDEARGHFRLCSQSQWNYEAAKKALSRGEWHHQMSTIQYRPFDSRFTVYDSHVAVHRRERLSHHLRNSHNLALITCRQTAVTSWEQVFVAADIVDDSFISNRTKERGYGLPLYLYPEEGSFDHSRRLNLEPKLYAAICKAGGINPSVTAEPGADFCSASGVQRPSEVQVFDYIYGVLHSLPYRQTFAEFLKSDFPRIPYPGSPEVFRHISEKGEQLRRLHLMEPSAIGETPYPYQGDGKRSRPS